jgi:hypothetical protein
MTVFVGIIKSNFKLNNQQFPAVVVVLLSILVIYLTYKQYKQSMEYHSTASSCSSYSPTNVENNSAKSSINCKRPFFTNALFHRRNEKSSEEQTGPDQ